uniref:AAA domain-containing protein n=1 Tax=Panagrellus redivivus TaxID=6233 RepID=A0A7E4UPL4_PANRE
MRGGRSDWNDLWSWHDGNGLGQGDYREKGSLLVGSGSRICWPTRRNALHTGPAHNRFDSDDWAFACLHALVDPPPQFCTVHLRGHSSRVAPWLEMDYQPSPNQSLPTSSDQPPPDTSNTGHYQPPQQPAEHVDSDMSQSHPERHRKKKRPDDYEEEEGEITDDDDDYDPVAYAKPPQPSSSASSLMQNINAARHLSSPEKPKKKKKEKREKERERDPYEFTTDDEPRPGPSKPSKHKHKHRAESPSSSDVRPPTAEKPEKKKVPPLRISLAIPKTEEEPEPTPSRSDEPHESAPSAESTPAPESKKPSTRSGGKKTTAQTNRVTRSQRRAKEDDETPRRRGAGASSLMSGFDDYDEYAGNEDEEDEKYYRQMLPPASPPERAWEIIQKNSFSGNKEFTALMKEAWSKMWPLDAGPEKAPPSDIVIPNYEKFMLNVRDYKTAADQAAKEERPLPETMLSHYPEWFRAIFVKHITERRAKKAEFEKQRNHLQLFGENEYLRALLGSMIRERSTFSVISKMRDETTFNPINFDSYQKEPEHPSRVPLTVQEAIDKVKKMALNLFNTHNSEAEVLYRSHWKGVAAALESAGLQVPDNKLMAKLAPKIYVHHVNFNYLVDPGPPEDDDEVIRESFRPVSPGFKAELEAEYAEIGGRRPEYVSKREQKMLAELAELEADDDEDESMD